MINPVIRVLVFDFDGVIVNSNQAKTEAFSEVFKDYPKFYDVMMQYHLSNISLSRVEKFKHLSQLLNVRDCLSFMEEILLRFSDSVKKKVIECPLVEGAQIILDKYLQKIPMYLASITPQQELDDILIQKKLDGYFKGVYGFPPWRKSDALEAIASEENVGLGSVLLIGDSYGDQRAAEIAGTNFVGIDSGLSFEDPMPIVLKTMREVDLFIENYDL